MQKRALCRNHPHMHPGMCSVILTRQQLLQISFRSHARALSAKHGSSVVYGLFCFATLFPLLFLTFLFCLFIFRLLFHILLFQWNWLHWCKFFVTFGFGKSKFSSFNICFDSSVHWVPFLNQAKFVQHCSSAHQPPAAFCHLSCQIVNMFRLLL